MRVRLVFGRAFPRVGLGVEEGFFALAPTVNRRVPVRDVARRARRGATGRPSGTARDMPRDVAMARLRLGTDRS
jgi:hypothetical protein